MNTELEPIHSVQKYTSVKYVHSTDFWVKKLLNHYYFVMYLNVLTLMPLKNNIYTFTLSDGKRNDDRFKYYNRKKFFLS